jgi:hypothetical protein
MKNATPSGPWKRPERLLQTSTRQGFVTMAETLTTRMVKQDLARAERIKNLVDSARQKSIEARADLDAAIALCEQDSYDSVKRLDKKDIQDIESVIRVAVTRPLNTISARWWDIYYGRKETVNEQPGR